MNTKKCVSKQQTTSSKVLVMSLQQGICSRRASKMMKMTFTETSRGIYIHTSSNNKPSGPPSGPGSKIKSLPEEKSDDELLAGI